MSRIEIGDRSITTVEIQELLATDHPMVEQLRFAQTPGHRGGELSFSLQILPRRGVRYLQQRDSQGRRVRPTWKTLTGREEIGQATRAIWCEGAELVAENCTFFPDQEFNDLGIGSALYVSLERLYRHLGIRRVTLLAVDVGVYVWARQGFAFAGGARMEGLVGDLQRLVRGQDPSVTLDAARFKESWDLANYDLPGAAIDGHRVGKAFMLDHVPSWHGVKYLDEPLHSEVAEASRRETFARLPEKIDCVSPSLAVR